MTGIFLCACLVRNRRDVFAGYHASVLCAMHTSVMGGDAHLAAAFQHDLAVLFLLTTASKAFTKGNK
ncbi:hypothetical protein EON63_20310, partial [archaeon]